MHIKTTRLSSRGRITLPVEMLRALNADEGTEFVVMQEDDRIVLMKAEAAGRRVNDLTEVTALASDTFEELWDNEADAVWDEA